MAAAQELSFTPSPLARGLMTGRTSTVGFIIGDSMSHRFAVPVMLGAEVALDEIDLSMITCDARGDPARTLELARMLAVRKVDGVLVVGDNNAITASVTRHVDVPVVYVYGESDEPGDVVHMPDDQNGIGLLVDHLVATGRRHIAHITGPRHATAVAHRVHGLSARLAEHQLRLAAPVIYASGPSAGPAARRPPCSRSSQGSMRCSADPTRSRPASWWPWTTWVAGCRTTSPSPATTTGRSSLSRPNLS